MQINCKLFCGRIFEDVRIFNFLVSFSESRVQYIVFGRFLLSDHLCDVYLFGLLDLTLHFLCFGYFFVIILVPHLRLILIHKHRLNSHILLILRLFLPHRLIYNQFLELIAYFFGLVLNRFLLFPKMKFPTILLKLGCFRLTISDSG